MVRRGLLLATLVAGCSSEPGVAPGPDAGDDAMVDTMVDTATGDAADTGDPGDTGTDPGDTGAAETPPDGGPFTYVVEARTLTSSGVARAFTLARPKVTAGAQLVIAFHGDGGNGPAFRAALPLEPNATRPTVFVYPTAPGGTFGYWDDAGRTKEAQFVRDVVDALVGELGLDRGRVFLTGFSGGATLGNALACRLGKSVIRAVAIHSGTLYPVTTASGKDDFQYDKAGAPTCPLPPAILAWGALDKGDTSFAFGQDTRDAYRAKDGCAATTKPAASSPCVTYDGCSVTWCPIDGMGHALWSGAAKAFQQWFDAR